MLRVGNWNYKGHPIRHYLDRNDVVWFMLEDLQKLLHMEDIPARCLPPNQIRYADVSYGDIEMPNTPLVNKGGVETLLWLQPEAVGNQLRRFLATVAGIARTERDFLGEDW